ncbi:MAG: PDZ domain-containing protein, partial [Pirellulaceae bacterium]|nr:PDZ domain-containing protein [Pirellulaceae bacterium]
PLSNTQASRRRPILGVQLEDAKEAAGALILEIIVGSPAEKIGLKTGDIIARLDGSDLKDSSAFREKMTGKSPGDLVKLFVKREAEEKEYEIQLASAEPPRNFDATRGSSAWRRDLYNLAVIMVEFPDGKHNDKIPREAWEQALFSDGRYIDKSVTGQSVYGSVKDYYREQSYGKLRVEGKVFDWVEVSKPKNDYTTGPTANNKGIFLGEALDKVLEREGKDALRDFDGVFFVYAGSRIRTNRGGLVLAAPGQLQPRWPASAVLHLPRGGQQHQRHQRHLPRVRTHARPARFVRPAGKPRLRRDEHLVRDVQPGPQRPSAAL